MKELFALIVMIWSAIGFMGIVCNGSYKRRINWYMVIWMLTVPFLPLFAKMCGLT